MTPTEIVTALIARTNEQLAVIEKLIRAQTEPIPEQVETQGKVLSQSEYNNERDKKHNKQRHKFRQHSQ